MIRIFIVLSLVFLLSSATIAQQKEQPSGSVAAAKSDVQSATDSAVRQSRLPDLQEILRRMSEMSLPEMGRVRHVFKDGALYLEMGGWSIPVPGGGASGCFSDNLRERVEALKQVIRTIERLR